MDTVSSQKSLTLTGSQLYKQYNPSIIQAQNVQRLRINRVALVQMLKVDHVLPRLVKNNVISDDERTLILAGKSQQDKTRNLLDILPLKGKECHWYDNFRESLKFPETRSVDLKRKYQILIQFLDNTAIQAPPKPPSKPKPPVSPIDYGAQGKPYPRYEPLPSISDSASPDKVLHLSRVSFNDGFRVRDSNSPLEEHKGCGDDREEKGMMDGEEAELENKDQSAEPHIKYIPIISNEQAKAYFHKEIEIPENYKSLIQEPKEHFEMLEMSDNADDKELLCKERDVLEKVRAMESAFAARRRKQLPEGLPLCFCKPVEDMLKDHDTYHLYFKYFQKLYFNYFLDVPAEITVAFTQAINSLEAASDDEVRQYVVMIGFGLFDFMHDYGQYNRAETVLLELMKYISTYAELDNWMAVWEGLVKMMTACNTNIQYNDTSHMHSVAVQMGEKIKLMSFGVDLLDESQMFTQMSIMMREQGSLGPSYDWAQRAIKEVESDNHRGIVDVLCNAVLSYAAMWNVKKAEDLALQAVQYAKETFGVNSPLYVKALLHFVAYSNEFRQDAMGVEVARKAVEIAEKIYGGTPNVQVAQAHEALAKALVVSLNFTDDEYYTHAQRALKTAIDVIPSHHPNLAPYKYTMAQVLQWRAMQHSDSDNTKHDLVCAETEAKDAMTYFKHYWGEYSIKTAQTHSLLGQVYTKMDRTEEAEAMLKAAYNIYHQAVPPNSNLQPLSAATFGIFYRSIGKPLEALDFLQKSVEKADTPGVYLKWVHMSYESIIALFRATNQMEEAERYTFLMAQWMKNNPRFSEPVSWQQLHQAPIAMDDFCQRMFSLATKLKAFSLKRGLRNLKDNKLKIEEAAKKA